MALTDTKGRAYARCDSVKPGMRLIADEGFGCVKPGKPVPVRTEEKTPRRLYLACACEESRNRHYLDVQDEGDGGLVGLYHADIFDGQPAELDIFKREHAALWGQDPTDDAA